MVRLASIIKITKGQGTWCVTLGDPCQFQSSQTMTHSKQSNKSLEHKFVRCSVLKVPTLSLWQNQNQLKHQLNIANKLQWIPKYTFTHVKVQQILLDEKKRNPRNPTFKNIYINSWSPPTHRIIKNYVWRKNGNFQWMLETFTLRTENCRVTSKWCHCKKIVIFVTRFEIILTSIVIMMLRVILKWT